MGNSPEQFCDYLGVDYETKGGVTRIICPFHDDSHPSMVIYPELERGSYCFAAETKVITRNGAKAIGDIVGEAVEVVNGNGEWEKVVFESYGIQELMKLVVTRNGVKKIIYATPEHEWFVKGYKNPITTQKLASKAGVRLQKMVVKNPFVPENLDQEAVQHGLLFGDGYCIKRGKRLRGILPVYTDEKDYVVSQFFPNSHPSWSKMPGNRVKKYTVALGYNPKTVFSIADFSDTYLFSFLAGYFAMDGCIPSSSNAFVIHSSNRANIELVADICDRLGIVHYGVKQYERKSGFSTANPFYYGLRFSMVEGLDKFLLGNKVAQSPRVFSNRAAWVIESVSKTSRVEEVFCCRTSTQSFVLEGNILTHNCFACGQGSSWPWLATQIKGITYPQALKDLELPVLPISSHSQPLPKPKAVTFCSEPVKRFVEAFKAKYNACGLIDNYAEAERFVQNKCLVDEAKKLGWRWHSAEDPQFKFWKDGLIIPYHINGEIAYVRYREFDWNTRKFAKPKGPVDVGIQPYYDTFRPCDTVFCVEGESDAASVWAHGCSAIGIPGAMAKKAINSVVAFIADHDYIKRVVLCGDRDEAGQKMNQLFREALLTMGVKVETVVYTVESKKEKADLNDDHVEGLFKPPIEWTCHYGDNYARCFGHNDFDEYVDRVDTYLGKCEAAGANPWAKAGNIELLPAADQPAEPKSQPEYVVTKVGEPQKSKYGGTFRYIFFKNLETGEGAKTCIDDKCHNRSHWDEVIALYEQHADFHLAGIHLKSAGLVNADSVPKVVYQKK